MQMSGLSGHTRHAHLPNQLTRQLNSFGAQFSPLIGRFVDSIESPIRWLRTEFPCSVHTSLGIVDLSELYALDLYSLDALAGWTLGDIAVQVWRQNPVVGSSVRIYYFGIACARFSGAYDSKSVSDYPSLSIREFIHNIYSTL